MMNEIGKDLLIWLGNVSGAIVSCWFAYWMLVVSTDVLTKLVLLTAGTLCVIGMIVSTMRLQKKYNLYNLMGGEE